MGNLHTDHETDLIQILWNSNLHNPHPLIYGVSSSAVHINFGSRRIFGHRIRPVGSYILFKMYKNTNIYYFIFYFLLKN